MNALQPDKKRYSEILSAELAKAVARGLRGLGFAGVRPTETGQGEREFQGGLGPKRVDVSYSDERHGLIMAVSVKTICFAPFGKNLKNRFADLCTEAVSLHLRFPYAVICGLFVFPENADQDVSEGRPVSTFRRAIRLFRTISGRTEYTDPPEKFEDIVVMCFNPWCDREWQPRIRLFTAIDEQEISEQDYFERLRAIHNGRFPHATVGEKINGS
jgi:hypothetical protein